MMNLRLLTLQPLEIILQVAQIQAIIMKVPPLKMQLGVTRKATFLH